MYLNKRPSTPNLLIPGIKFKINIIIVNSPKEIKSRSNAKINQKTEFMNMLKPMPKPERNCFFRISLDRNDCSFKH